MCGIIGYVGKREAQPILLNGLRLLEYRGYDSAGMCTLLGDGKRIFLHKLPGKVKDLEHALKKKSLSGSLGIGHCLAPDTYVFLSDGRIKKIADLTDGEGVISIELPNLRCRNSNEIKIFCHRSPPYLYRVKTSYFTFVASGEHRIFTADPSGTITEKKVKDITDELIAMPAKISSVEDCISCKLKSVPVEKHFIVTGAGREILKRRREMRGSCWEEIENSTGINSTYIKRIEKGERISIEETRLKKLSKYYNIDFSPELFRSENFITNDVTLSDFTSDEIMQILGYIIGDGHITERMIRFKESDKNVCMTYQNLFKKVFNIRSNLKKKKGHYIFVISSRYLANWLRENFPILLLPGPKKDLPEFTGNLPESQIAGLLKGLFDAEGAVATLSGQVVITMTSKHIIQKIQLFLLRFGVLSTYNESVRKIKNWNDVYRLSINDNDSMMNFYKAIGFSSPNKQRKLLALVNSVKNFNYKHFHLPIRLDEFYRNYLRPTGIKGWHKIRLKPQKSYLTSYRLGKLLKWIDQNGNSVKHNEKKKELISCVKKFVNSDIVWVRSKITKIPSPYRFVYDLEVTPSSNFIGNGIMQHNSRWATHGAPNQVNAHPHLDCKGEIAVVHNGIIENYAQLKEQLTKEGHRFKSQTDTEVIVHLIEKFYKSIPFEEAVRKAIAKLEGSFAIACISKREPQKLVGARLGSPLIVGLGKEENFLASDVPAVLNHTKDVIFLNENEMAVLTKDKCEVTDFTGRHIPKSASRIKWSAEQAEKQGYAHFMLKEINEQPAILENFLKVRIKDKANEINFEELTINDDALKKIKNIAIVACGTAYHAGLIGKYVLESICGIPTSAEVSSEFRYKNLLVDKETLVIAISQSGETADTLAGVKEAKRYGSKVLSIVNVLGSTLTRESDGVIYTHAGPEIGVASTKAYTAQVTALYLFALHLAKVKHTLTQREINKYIEELRRIPRLQREILKNQAAIARLARRHSHFGSFLYLGRSLNFPSALEGALKLKEISYIPAEGYAAGEMKHGPIALIDEYRAVVCIALRESKVYEKMFSNIQEIRARKGKIIAIAGVGDEKIKREIKEVIHIPNSNELFSPLLVAIPLQLLAYHIAVKRGCNVDQPRNLAKSVTVE
ncbi:MAG: hypothetical protein A2987_03730 [Omnitrophica bacterium RIFCSPLOWO2_01_FULL_45_10]|nr:MAG: hypothetical protein A2987_03730 [Omnitrophica bacterium RIFCSPLOWO2_01_FULL_45_10]